MALNGKSYAVVMPGHNVAQPLEVTLRDLPDIVDVTILVEDHSSDETGQLGKHLGLTICTRSTIAATAQNIQVTENRPSG